MPTYPFTCRNCGKPFSIFMSYEEYEKKKVKCPHCQSSKAARRIGRVRFARSQESRIESMADPSAMAGIEDDPKAMAKMMRQMSSEMGDEIGDELGPEFNEVVDRLESGQSPEEIEKSLPDLGTDDGGDL